MEDHHGRLLRRQPESDHEPSPLGRLRGGLSRLFGGSTPAPTPEHQRFDIRPARRHARAVIYARRVYDQHGEVISTVEDQEAQCRAHASQRGYAIVDTYLESTEDPEESRPELRRLRAAMWRRSIDVVVAASPERLYFDANRLIRFAREAHALDVQVEFADGTSTDDLLSDW